MPIRVELELQDGSFTSRMIHAGETVQQFERNVGQGVVAVNRLNETSSSFLGTIRDVTVTLGMARAAFETIRGVTTGWAGDIVKVNAEMERLRFLLAGMSKAADPMKEAGQQVKYLRDFAKDAPFSLAALSDTFVKMKSTGIDPMSGALKGLVDGIAAFGGTDETLKRATVAITQMSGKGVIQMEELRQQLGEAMPRAVELMARSMGVSVPQLIQDISKGTLDAKTSLAAFNMELERSFGGAAAEQMNTFNGMIAKSKTLMQDLALRVGDAGFFDAVKNQLRDINAALSGDFLKSLSTQAGSGLSQVVNWMGQAVQSTIRLRDEIMLAGEVLLGAFAVSKISALFGSMTNQVSMMRAEWAALRVQFALTTSSLSGAGGMVMGVRSLSDAMTAFSLAAGAGGTALARLMPLLGAGAAFISGWALPVAALGLALWGLYEAFGKTKSAADDAYESIVKFGAESRQQVRDAMKSVEADEARLQKLRELKAEQDAGAPGTGTGGAWITDGMIEGKVAEIADKRKRLGDAMITAEKRDGERIDQLFTQQLDARMRRLSASYDQQQTAASEASTKERNAMIAAGKDVSAFDKKRQEDKRAADIAFYELQKQTARQHLTDMQALIDGGDSNALLVMERQTEAVIARIAAAQQNIETTSKMALGPQSNQKALDPEKLLEKAKSKIDELNSTIAGQKAELQGASNEYAKLAYLIESSMSKGNLMWRLQNTELATAVDKIRELSKESEDYLAKITGQNAFDNDLLSTKQTLLLKIAEASSKSKDPLDLLAAKQSVGAYSGMTPIQRMVQGIAQVGTEARQAGSAMETAFGAGVQDKGNGLLGILERIGGAWRTIGRNAAGAVDAAGGAAGPRGRSTYQVGSTFADNLIRRESGGDPNASNSSSTAVGLGQFIESTWMQFLKEARPEVLEAGRQAALDARKDPTLARAAVEWYASQNADKLQGAGVTPTDSNLYLAHFLGPGGAIAALTKSTDTLLSTIPQLDAARKSNPEVFRDLLTVGDLKSWSQSFMGPLMTASRTGANTNSLGSLLGSANNGKQVDALMEIQQLQDVLKKLTWNNNLSDKTKEFVNEIGAAKDNADGLHKNYAKFVALIKTGEFGNKDPDAPMFAEAIKKVKELDAAQEDAAKRRKQRQKVDQILDTLPSKQEALDDQSADIQRRLADESKLKLSDGYYAELRKTLRDVKSLQDDIAANPANADRNNGAIDVLNSQLEQRRNKEISEQVLIEQQKAIAVEQGLMTQDQARADAHRRDLQRLEEYLRAFQGTAEERVLIEERVARIRDTLNKSFAASSPIARTMREWNDVSNNLQKSAANWMEQSTDKLADFAVTGKAAWADLSQAVMKDMAKMAIKAGTGWVFNSLGGGAGKVGGGGGAGKMVAQHHSGGMAGSVASSRMVDPSVFLGAPRWHTGTGGLTLGGDEIPIIAKRGEQVDWPENLAKQYGGAGNIIAPTIAVSVQGSAGMSAADHEEMGRRIGDAAMVQVQKMMAKELRTQTRPGGTLKKR